MRRYEWLKQMKRQEEAPKNIGHETVRCCLLPKDMRPSKRKFEELGFIFADFGDSIVCQALLPSGWKMKNAGENLKDLVDENGKKRCICFYDATVGNRSGYMEIIPLAV